MSDRDLCFLPAVELLRLIRERQVSCREVMEAHLERIERTNPRLNAIVTLLPEKALEGANEADRKLAAGESVGPLHGLPIAHKDLVMTAGIRTTFGSRLLSEFVPDVDELLVRRLREAGTILVGKTNTPEFGAGSQTFNEVFGKTLNPYDPTKTCGGSSGGAAVALATGMLPLADGSDLGGSLRNPASFCNVVGFRPSPGRVPVVPTLLDRFTLPVSGPMARTVPDVALMLSVIAGPDPRSPISLDEPGERFRDPPRRDFAGVRIAYSRDLGGLPVDPRVSAVIEGAVPVLESLGCVVETVDPDLSGADSCFKTLRAWAFARNLSFITAEQRRELKDTVIWNIERGEELTDDDVARAEGEQIAISQRFRAFMRDREFLVLPVNQVVPFDVNQPYPTEIDGVAMETYIDWMKSAYFITVTGHPAISVPCGFTPEGLPVGLQIVGRRRDDLGVLQLARSFEEATGVWKRRPEA
jgi:amidase